MTNGIPTVYRGIRYRSRLEARWAAFFDEIGWKYTYEPFDGNGYIPDFLIHEHFPFLVEVKPAVTLDDYLEPWPKIYSGLAGHWQGSVFLAGVTPLPSSLGPLEDGPGGIMSWGKGLRVPATWVFDPRPPVEIGLMYENSGPLNGFTSTCGYYDPCDEELRGLIGSKWAAACNAVQWHAS